MIKTILLCCTFLLASSNAYNTVQHEDYVFGIINISGYKKNYCLALSNFKCI